jgi:two-component system, OmpR family, response regulator MprA
MRILVVDDDRSVRESLRRSLAFNGYQVDLASDGQAALDAVTAQRPDAMVLDVMMPRLDGLEVCRRMRAGGDDLPILVLTARDAVSDRVSGLDAGADDYLPKPFAFPELLARVRALSRRPPEKTEEETVLTSGDVTLDPGRHEVRRAGERIELTAKEFALLATLMQRPGQVFTRSVLLDAVWGGTTGAYTNVVDLYVHYLRKKIDAGEEPSRIRTVHGMGYTFDPRS